MSCFLNLSKRWHRKFKTPTLYWYMKYEFETSHNNLWSCKIKNIHFSTLWCDEENISPIFEVIYLISNLIKTKNIQSNSNVLSIPREKRRYFFSIRVLFFFSLIDESKIYMKKDTISGSDRHFSVRDKLQLCRPRNHCVQTKLCLT